MKRLLLLVAAAAFAACGNNPRKTVADRQQDDCVEVLCFYGAKRCATCIAIVVIVAWLLAYSVAGLGAFYNRMQAIQKWLSRIVGLLFIAVGIYYEAIYFC